jgi:peptide/nickel transport system substrate-binding protein
VKGFAGVPNLLGRSTMLSFLARSLARLALVVPLLAAMAFAQPLDISTVIPEYSKSNPKAEPGTYGSEIRLSPFLLQPLTSLNVFNDRVAASYVAFLYPRFMENSPITYENYCNICVSYEVSQDGKDVVFHLREGIHWSDGMPITAADVVSTAEILSDPDVNSDSRQFFDDGEIVSHFEAIDEKTVRMTLTAPLPEKVWKARMRWQVLPGSVFGSAYEEGGVEALKNLYPVGSEDLVSAGDWRFGSYDSKTGRLVFEQNREYSWKTDSWGNKLPYVDRLILTPTETTEVQALISGQADFASSTSIADPESLERLTDAGMVVRELHGRQSKVAFIVPNFTHTDPEIGALMRERDFRVALSHLFDRRALIDQNFGQMARVAFNYNMLPAFRDLPYPRYSYDPQTAYELLEGIGLYRDTSRTACPGGCYVLPSGSPLRLGMMHFERELLNASAEYLVRNLSDLGLEVYDVTAETNDYVNRVHTRDSEVFRQFDLLFRIGGASMEGQEFLTANFDVTSHLRHWGVSQNAGEPPANLQPWEQRLSEIASRITSVIPPAERIALVAEGSVLFAENLPMIPLFEVRVFESYSPRIANTADQVSEVYKFVTLYELYPLIHVRK